MDEILIEEKKYVSSRQAAKITGYAKDYIGQLSREGRIPARLVGRSWYVLESAIQDHRFGNQEAEPKEAAQTKSSPDKTWEFPRYEAAKVEILPSVNRLHVTEEASVVHEGAQEIAQEAPQNLHDSWKAWFDHVAETISSVEAPVVHSVDVGIEKEEQEEEILGVEMEEDEVIVPLRVMNRYEEPLPADTRAQENPAPQSVRRSGLSRVVGTIKIVGVLLAVISVALAVIGSGYLDEYILSSSQAQIISGATVYVK